MSFHIGVPWIRRTVSLLLSAGLVLNVLLASAQPAAAEGDSVFVVEGETGTTDAIFTVGLSTEQPNPVTVDYFTSNGTAAAGRDYEATNGTLTFMPGETRKVVTVPVIGDRIPEGDEVFYLNVGGVRATGTIIDDDPSIGIGGVTVMEGDSGTHGATFVVTLTVPAGTSTPPGGRWSDPVKVSYATSDGTATGGQDYMVTKGTISFAAGETSKLVTIPILGDAIPERDETFFVNLLNPSRGEITTVQGQGLLLNDDAVAFTGEPPAESTVPGGPVPPGARPSVSGVRTVTSSGQVVIFGDAGFFGSLGGLKLNQAVVGTAATPSRNGYWLAAADGGVFVFGDAKFLGSTGGPKLNQPIVGIAATPTGNGYWLVAADGGIFSFGDAKFFGSTGGIKLNRPIVGMAATPTGNGYWLVAADGGIFSFGDAKFFGSTGGIKLTKPIVGMAATPGGSGYWLVASDGGIFSFGDAQFVGSAGGFKLNEPIVGMSATPTGKGYWLIARDGGLFAFGDAPFFTPKTGLSPGTTVVGMTS
jgi:hypothetical protein